jgi:D-glycero-alpha-D-manno-heptose-7-phosphate kinase
MKIVRSKAPLRLGLAGGGTDIDNYSRVYGGVVLNATINMYAHCTIEIIENDEIHFIAKDLGVVEIYKLDTELPVSEKLPLHCGVYNRIVKDFNNNKPIALKITTYADAPAGSGLGTSSAIVVAILKAFIELLKLPLGEYDVAHLAYEIERVDLNLAGGKQDQYAATFGGFNFIEFYSNDRVIVNPLRIRQWMKDELEESLVLFFTGKSRESANIIKDQIASTIDNKQSNLEGMHQLKEAAYKMKEALLKGDVNGIALELKNGWEAKKKTSKVISNPLIEDIYLTAIQNGAIAGKISGAGGGGFMMFIVDPLRKLDVINALNKFDGKVQSIEFVDRGTKGWYI